MAPHRNVTRLLISTQGSASKANSEYEKIMNGPPPAAPVFAARLNGLLKTIADGEDALAQMVRARTELKSALDDLQTQYQALLEADQQRLLQLTQRRAEVDERKQEVEDKIVRDLARGTGTGNGNDTAIEQNGGMDDFASPIQEPPRPEMEALTPPSNDPDTMGEFGFNEEQSSIPSVVDNDRPAVSTFTGPPQVQIPPSTADSVSSIEVLSHLTSQAVPVNTNGANKRRRVASEDVPDLDDGIDADVVETLRRDSLS